MVLSKTLLMNSKFSLESTDSAWSHVPALLDSPLGDTQENVRCLLSIFPVFSAFLSWGSDRRCVLSMQWANTEWLQIMLHQSWESRCAPHRQLCRAKSLQCLVSSTFLLCQLFFCSLSLSVKCFLCPLFLDKFVFACLNMWACVCACGFIEISGNTVGNYQRNLQQFLVSLNLGDSRPWYLQVECVQLQTAEICLSLFFLCFFFSFAGTAFSCSRKSISSPLREREGVIYTLVWMG